MDNVDVRRLTDEELWAHTERLAQDSRDATADLVDALAELDERRLAEKSNVYASLHEYCVHKLHMTDACAYRHIRAARSIRRFPPIGPALRNGRLNLQVIAMLHPHLEDADADELVGAALGKRVHEVEALIAPRRTEAPRKDVVRLIANPAKPSSLPDQPPPSNPSTENQTIPGQERAVANPEGPGPVRYDSRSELYASIPENSPVSPKAPARHSVRIGFTADESFDQLLKEVQAAMRHKYPDGSLEGIFRDALRALLKKNRPWAFPKAVRAGRG